MRVLVVTHPTPKDIKKLITLGDSDVIIAVDQAVLALYKQRIKIDLAVGDFDSLKNDSMLSQLNVIRLNPIKDTTDTHQALVEAKKMMPDELILIGGIGGDRIDHFIIHTMLFDEFEDLKIIDDHTEMSLLKQGAYTVKTKGYVTYVAYPKAVISLHNFKYPLQSYLLNTYDPLCISNEVLGDTGEVIIHEGRVLQIKTLKE